MSSFYLQKPLVVLYGTARETSSRCPSCDHHQKPKGRVWRCKRCGFIGHRNLVGSVNMHPVAFGEPVPFLALCTTRIDDPARRIPGERRLPAQFRCVG